MATVEDIRRGLAAQLRTVLAEDEGHVSPYWDISQTTVCLQVAGIESMNPTTYDGGREWVFLIEGVFPLTGEPRSQKVLDRLLLEDAVADAVEADTTPLGALYSRLADDNTVTTDTDAPAAQSVTFIEYRGSGRDTLKNGNQVLVANWAVRVDT